MKKQILIALTICIALFGIVGIDLIQKVFIDSNIHKAKYYNNIITRNQENYTLNKVIDEESVVVLGSSELSAADNIAYPPSLYNYGYSNFNLILMGAGSLQSIAQAINVGALQNNIKNGKVVLIVSPQWFATSGVSAEMFSSRFEEQNYLEFIKNKNISKKTRIAVSDRVKVLLEPDPMTLERVKKYEEVYLYHTSNIIKIIEVITYSFFRDSKTRFKLKTELQKMNDPIDYNNFVEVDKINYDQLMLDAIATGKEECTNNEYGVYDDYFDKYIKERYDELKDSYKEQTYTVSPEYDDLRLFLNVCTETGIEPLVVSVPVNGRWYDYCGFSKSDRNTYYNNIREICNAYDVPLADFSEKEYEKYYLKDIMHMGWKGWVYLNQAVLSFYKGEEIKDKTQYRELTPLSASNMENVNANKDTFKLSTDIEDNIFNAVVATVAEDGLILDMTSNLENRSCVFLHTNNSGEYTIRIRGNTNKKDEAIEFKYYLESEKVYKLNYKVEELTDKSVSISNINLSEVIY